MKRKIINIIYFITLLIFTFFFYKGWCDSNFYIFFSFFTILIWISSYLELTKKEFKNKEDEKKQLLERKSTKVEDKENYKIIDTRSINLHK